MFWRVGTIPSTGVICCCSRVRGTGVHGTCDAGGEGPEVAFGATVKGATGAVEGLMSVSVLSDSRSGRRGIMGEQWNGQHGQRRRA
jgi:hypothetical protein